MKGMIQIMPTQVAHKIDKGANHVVSLMALNFTAKGHILIECVSKHWRIQCSPVEELGT